MTEVGWLANGHGKARALSRLHASPLHKPVSFPGWSAADTRWMPSSVRRFIIEAEMTIEHLQALVVWIVGGVVCTGGLAVWVSGPHAFVLFGAVAGVPILLAKRRAGRRSRAVVASLPDVIDMVARSIRSGASLPQAIAETASSAPGAVAKELGVVWGGVSHGQTLAFALRGWVDRMPLPEVRLVVAALSTASRNEAGSTLALAGLSQSLRDRAALADEIRSQTAQAAASLQAMVLLPLLFLVIDLGAGNRVTTFLLGEPFGRLCLGAAVVLDALGWWWMASIVRRRLPT